MGLKTAQVYYQQLFLPFSCVHMIRFCYFVTIEANSNKKNEREEASIVRSQMIIYKRLKAQSVKKWFFSDFSNWFQTPFDCLIWVTDNNIRTDSWLLSEREREKKSKRARESKRSLNLKGLTPFQHELRRKNYNRSHFSLFLNHRMTIFQTFHESFW